jgi:hypothetical protein
MMDRSNAEFILAGNQSFNRLPEKTRAILTNKILGDLRVVAEKGDDFLVEFRYQADQQLKRCDFEKHNPFGLWKKIHRQVLVLVTQGMGSKSLADEMVDNFLSRQQATANGQ